MQLPGDLNCGPRRCGRKTPCYPLQRSADALMNHQTDRRSHPHARIEHVNGGAVFCVKAEQDRRCAHANHGSSPHKDVKCGQAAQQIWLIGCVNAVPHADKATIFDFHIELLAGHYHQQLRRGGEAAGLL